MYILVSDSKSGSARSKNILKNSLPGFHFQIAQRFSKQNRIPIFISKSIPVFENKIDQRSKNHNKSKTTGGAQNRIPIFFSKSIPVFKNKIGIRNFFSNRSAIFKSKSIPDFQNKIRIRSPFRDPKPDREWFHIPLWCRAGRGYHTAGGTITVSALPGPGVHSPWKTAGSSFPATASAPNRERSASGIRR